jgi:stress response protein YsnF
LVPDLRFNDALRAIVEVKEAGKTKIVITGFFRTSDRQPKSQAQWEDVLKLYEQMVPKERQPIEVVVQIDGKSIGKLTATKTETRKVPLEMAPSHGAKEVRAAEEEVATEISGEVELPAGRQELMLIHHHIVDGLIEGLGIGMAPLPPAPKPEKKK